MWRVLPEDVTGVLMRLRIRPRIRGCQTAVIATDETKASYTCSRVFSIGTRVHEESIAQNLFEILRKMDTLSVDVIYSESFEGGGLGQAIMNRLLKAAGHHVIQANQSRSE